MRKSHICSAVLLGIVCLVFPITSYGDDFESTAEFYDSMVNSENPNEAMLTLFFNQMPKGGDLHHHYSGTIYVETYLDWVQKQGWFIDSCTLMIVKDASQVTDKKCKLLTVAQVRSAENDALYRKILSTWSNKDYGKLDHTLTSPEAHFFNTFYYFYPIDHQYMDLGLERIKKRAVREKVSYIETMLTEFSAYGPQVNGKEACNQFNQSLRNMQSQQDTDEVLEKLETRLLESDAFTASINQYLDSIKKNHQGIDDGSFTMRYQAYALRVTDPVQVFIELLAGHRAADKSPLVVGVNILGPEHNHVALQDYTLHMRMFHYLSEKYPSVQTALHAGELTLGLVRPENLRFHIRQASEIAGAKRIGHGVDLMYETNAPKLLGDLKKNTAIEINLTSNEFILGVKGQSHPYLIYSEMNVPIVISSDDSGVSRNNLSNEYVLLAKRYRPSYPTIKKYVYNSIRYSFLNDEDKQRVKGTVDVLFKSFEKDMAALYQARKN